MTSDFVKGVKDVSACAAIVSQVRTIRLQRCSMRRKYARVISSWVITDCER